MDTYQPTSPRSKISFIHHFQLIYNHFDSKTTLENLVHMNFMDHYPHLHQNRSDPASSYKSGGEHQNVRKPVQNERASERGPFPRLAHTSHTFALTLYRHTHVARAGWSSSTKNQRRSLTNFLTHIRVPCT